MPSTCLAGNQLLGAGTEQAVHLGETQAPQLDDVLEPFRGEQREPRSLTLDDRVDADRRAVHKAADPRRVEAVSLLQQGETIHHLAARLVRRREDLQRMQPVRSLIEQAEIDECAADIDADPPSHANPTQQTGIGSLRVAGRICPRMIPGVPISPAYGPESDRDQHARARRIRAMDPHRLAQMPA